VLEFGFKSMLYPSRVSVHSSTTFHHFLDFESSIVVVGSERAARGIYTSKIGQPSMTAQLYQEPNSAPSDLP
jgi:hypothetical protein